MRATKTMIAARILKPESLVVSKPYCAITLSGNRGNNYYYFEPTLIGDDKIKYTCWREGKSVEDNFSFRIIFEGSIMTYKLSSGFPKLWGTRFSELLPEIKRPFHLENP